MLSSNFRRVPHLGFKFENCYFVWIYCFRSKLKCFFASYSSSWFCSLVEFYFWES